MQEFKRITDEMIQALESLELIYRNEEEVNRDRDFFNYVKQETKTYFTLLENWKTLALNLSMERKISIVPAQIDATVDNIKALILHSYYKDVRKRQYMNIKKSCNLVFIQSLDENIEE